MERKVLFLVLLAIYCEWSLAKKECNETCSAKGKCANLNIYKYIKPSLKIHPRKTFKLSKQVLLNKLESLSLEQFRL